MSFRRYEGFGSAEVMTSRGSRSVAVEHLAKALADAGLDYEPA